MADQTDPSIGWQKRLPTVRLQIEYFLLKFPDVDREKALEMAEAFKKHDSRGRGELQEDEALRLLESRKETKRVVELREMIKEMDFDKNRELSMLEWSCAYFSKSWKALHTPSDNQAEIDAAMAKLRQVIEAENRRKEEEERREREAKEQRENDLQKVGIKGAAAKFHYAAADTADQTKTNADKIKAEAAARKAKKDAEDEKKKAEMKSVQEREEMIRKQEELKRSHEEEERIAAEKEVERKAKVQAALKAKFGGSN